MAIVKKRDLRAMSVEELKIKLKETELAFMEERANIKGGKRQKQIKYKPLRKLKARIKTYLHQRGVKT
ncbi:MAG: 50S ribosomal protein L29 [Candidatus Micrarchaeota archaeon]